jgi:fido (protein-threonine AMPylation protein)
MPTALEPSLAIAWNTDDPADAAILSQNLRQILRQITKQANLRQARSVAMAQDWHRRAFAGARLPIPYFAGEIRDSDPRFPELYGYEVSVGDRTAVASSLVPDEIRRFEHAMRQAVAVLDTAMPVGAPPGDAAQLSSTLTLCAHSHGEWVRIHPFANGNGRTARLWANWCALRYGLPPFVKLRPRPAGSAYATASALSMRGDHRLTVGVFVALLDEHLAIY